MLGPQHLQHQTSIQDISMSVENWLEHSWWEVMRRNPIRTQVSIQRPLLEEKLQRGRSAYARIWGLGKMVSKSVDKIAFSKHFGSSKWAQMGYSFRIVFNNYLTSITRVNYSNEM